MARLIARAFLRQLPASVRREDIEQAALVGLWDALRRGGPAEPHYLRMRIRGSIRDELRRHDWLPRRSRSLRLRKPIDVVVLHFDETEKPETALPCPADSPEALTIGRADAAALARAISAAPLRARDRAIALGHARGATLAELAVHFGISEPRANQIYHRAIRVLRAYLARTTHPELRGLTRKDK